VGQEYVRDSDTHLMRWNGSSWLDTDAGGGVSPTIGSVSIPFTNGDAVQRVTVSSGSIGTGSKIRISVTRPNVADVDDPGYLYIANVVSRGAESFDVVVSAVDVDGSPCWQNPPAETVTLEWDAS
jgi:hypothetical protein